jgi:hypothetical protein
MTDFHKWVIMSQAVYDSLNLPPTTAKQETAEQQLTTSHPSMLTTQVKPLSRSQQAIESLKRLLEPNQHIGWQDDQLTLYGQKSGRVASRVLGALASSKSSISVAGKIILQLLSSMPNLKRTWFTANNLSHVWKKLLKFQRANQHKYRL